MLCVCVIVDLLMAGERAPFLNPANSEPILHLPLTKISKCGTLSRSLLRYTKLTTSPRFSEPWKGSRSPAQKKFLLQSTTALFLSFCARAKSRIRMHAGM